MPDSTFFWLVAPGLATGLGGLGLLVPGRPSDRLLDTLLGATGGIMLAAAFFSLLVPALADGTVGEVTVGFLVGGGTLALLDATIPHVHARFRERSQSRERHRATLLLSALTIHNLPEGLAVGVAFAAGGSELGIPIAVAIGLQNPEGFAAARPARRGAGVGADGDRLRRRDGARRAAGGAARVSDRRLRSVAVAPRARLRRGARWSTSSWTRCCPRAASAGTSARRRAGSSSGSW